MVPILKGKKIITRLNTVWRESIVAKGLTGELAYRLEKLALRLDTISGKIFMKTIKAQDILCQCEQLTEQFKVELGVSQRTALHLLTRLEAHMDDLVKQTHEFRIKAG